MKKLFLLLIIFYSVGYAQIVTINSVPKDTSYTIYSAAKKIIIKYPEAEAVFIKEKLEIKELKGIEFRSIGERKLKIDLFLPSGKKEANSIIILIHGGGWVSGDRSLMYPIAESLAGKGIAAAAVEYRLAPEKGFPAAVLDIKSAVAWIKKNADQFNIDGTKIILAGFSAGGHLAAFCGLTNSIAEFNPDSSSDGSKFAPAAVINVDGILDFTDPAESGKDSNPAKPSVGKRWLGYSYKENPAIWIKASPLQYAGNDSPPVCFINSSIPRFHAGRDEMIEKLNNAGIYSEVHTIEDSPHSFWLFRPWFSETIDIIARFADKIGGK